MNGYYQQYQMAPSLFVEGITRMLGTDIQHAIPHRRTTGIAKARRAARKRRNVAKRVGRA